MASNTTTHLDYIIVGQGLAGSAVAIQAIKRNKKILVIDNLNENSSSRIAAGLFNPITGKKMTRTWLADTLFPYLIDFYQFMEDQTQQRFFKPMSLYRPFLSIEEQNEWMAKSAEPLFLEYIERVTNLPSVPAVVDDFGGLFLKKCGYLDTSAYIDATRKWIQKTNLFLDDNFDQDQLNIEPQGVDYKGYHAKKIVFCQGCSATTNKWFDWVPVRPLKGETLKIKTDYKASQIINRGVYVVPSGETELRVGATYNFNDLSPEITDHARMELEGKLNELVKFDYKIVSQEWGVRPTTPDRRPIMGAHPEHPALIIFNGMGTKGVSLTPYFSEVLVRWMEKEIDLNKEVDVNRYKVLYSKFTK